MSRLHPRHAGRRRRLTRLGTAGLLLALAGCGLFPSKPPKVEFGATKVLVDCDANDNSVVAFDFVWVRDPVLVNVLAETTARAWFGNGAQLRRQLQEKFADELEFRSWELVPGQIENLPAATLDGRRALAVFLFAHYAAEGPNRLRLDRLPPPLLLNFGRRTFEALPARSKPAEMRVSPLCAPSL